MKGYSEAKAELEKVVRYLDGLNPSAARSLEEGLEETLTLHRLGIPDLLRTSLNTTNIIGPHCRESIPCCDPSRGGTAAIMFSAGPPPLCFTPKRDSGR